MSDAWRKLLDGAANRRCDLDILLIDKWRHTVVLRDGATDAFRRDDHAFRIEGEAYDALVGLDRDEERRRLRSLLLVAVHGALASYGHGSVTVVASAEQAAGGGWRGCRIVPSVFDHEAAASLTRRAASRLCDLASRGAERDGDQAALVGHGCFDAVVALLPDASPPLDVSPFALGVVARDRPGSRTLAVTISYPADLIGSWTANGLADVLRGVLGQVATQGEAPFGTIALLSDAHAKVLDGWNATDAPFRADARLDTLFEEAVERNPEREALRWENGVHSYRTLDRECNRLAHWLLGPGRLRTGVIVALFLDQRHLAVIAELAIWKAGCSFVAIDPSYPDARIGFILRDAGAACVLASRRHLPRLAALLGPNAAAVALDDLLAGADPEELADGASHLPVGQGSTAYVAYTSGTTGDPKGIAKSHRSVVNSITDLSVRYGMAGAMRERIALFSAVVFEPFIRQILMALTNGHALVVVPDAVRLDPLALASFLEEHGITYLNGTGSALQHCEFGRCTTLLRLMLVGEELTATALRTLRAMFAGTIVNEYSFTETAFVTAVKVFPPDVSSRSDRSIGRPLRNITCYILAPGLRRLPIGAVGELFVGGEGIGRGYLNRDDLTARSFFANPFRTPDEVRRGTNTMIYRTGDLARYLPNGEIEFLGRGDFQFKLNGVRVEPGEIEARILEHPRIRQCVVMPIAEEGTGLARHLVGYVVADPDCDVDDALLKAFLKSRLIDVMIPRHFLRLQAFPTTHNGKVDRRALPMPAVERDGSRAAGDTTAILRTIWAQVLGLPASHPEQEDDFFALGGQSIACIQLIAAVWRSLRVRLTLEQVFRSSRFAAMASLAASLRPDDKREPTPPAQPVEAGPLPANGLQKGLLYTALKNGDEDDAYVIQSVYRYGVPIDAELMRRAWQVAYERFPALRLRFAWNDEPLQIIGPASEPIEWHHLDRGASAGTAAEDEALRVVQRADRARPYALRRGPLFRVYLVRQGDQRFAMLFSCHHIIIDGWSLPLLHDEVHRIYLDLLDGRVPAGRPDTAFVEGQLYLHAHRADHLDEWNRQLEAVVDRSDLNGLVDATHRYAVDLRRYDRVRDHRSKTLVLSSDRVAALKIHCVRHQVTLHSALQLVWHLALRAFGGAQTTVVGTIVSLRGLPVEGIEHSVGLFINTLPIVVDHRARSGGTVAAALTAIQSDVNLMNERGTVELTALAGRELKHELFDSLLVLENYPRLLPSEEAQEHRRRLRFEHVYDADKVDYPLAVVAREADERLEISLWYAGELFEDVTIDTVLDTVDTLFEQIAAGFDRPVGRLRLLSAAAEAALDGWNDRAAPFPSDQTLDGLFAAAAARWPGEPAVACGPVLWSYARLDREADRLARGLRAAAPLRPDDLVALVMDKSEHMIAAILGVWKAGAAYLPIDPAAPDERIAFMLHDAAAVLVVADAAHRGRLARIAGAGGRPVLDAGDLGRAAPPAALPAPSASPRNLAYAIYTSGTTGRPKAVLVEHRGVVNLHASLARTFGLSRDDGREAVLSFSNYVFDHFVEQMTDALLNGQKLVILDDAMRTDPARLHRYMRDQAVTYLSGTPSVLSLYAYAGLPALRRIDAIGEDFTAAKFDQIRASFAGLIINGYGPTEISITSHKRLYGPGEPRRDKSIGYPVSNTRCYVVDPEGRRLPVGGVGELLIGGEGVARGYLNREALTRERFIADPFRAADGPAPSGGGRLYRTGDLVRWLANGELEYLGRNDFQVKIRGQRVELGEVEGVLAALDGVRQAAVVAGRHPGTAEDRLLAFYISDDPIDPAVVESWMLSRLPHALVPVSIRRVPELPVTSNGKLDVRRLPAIGDEDEEARRYVAPDDGRHAQLCGIWARVLGLPLRRIGVADDFFALGGDSLRATMLANAVSAELGSRLTIAAVFAHRTVASQAQHLATVPAAAEVDLRPDADAPASDPLVSLAQEPLLFIAAQDGGSAAYNVTFALELAARPELRAADVEAALRALISRHAALRTFLPSQDIGGHVQHILGVREAAALFSLPEMRAATAAELDDAIARQSGIAFELDRDLPIRALLVWRDGGPVLVVVVHHCAFDGWSLSVFRRELEALLGGVDPAALPSPRATYAEFAHRQRALVGSRWYADLCAFWASELGGWEPLGLPLDRPRPRVFDFEGATQCFELAPDQVAGLRKLGRAAGVSLFSVLVAAYTLMLRAFTHRDDLLVGTPSANRTQPRYDDVIGFFANMIVLRARVDRGAPLVDHLRATGDMVVRALAHQEMPFDLLVRMLGAGREPSRPSMVEAVFVLEDERGTDQTSVKPYLPARRSRTAAKFELSAVAREHAAGLSVTLTYAASLFEPATVASMAARFRDVLVAFAAHGDPAAAPRIGDLMRASPWPDAPRAADGTPQTLDGLFATAAARWPGEPAVACGPVLWSYARLDREADRLARGLRAAAPLRPDDLVALVMDKSEHMIAAILGVWKAGAAYLPIDPAAPDERIAFMLHDAAAVLVVADAAHRGRLARIAGAGGRPVLDAGDLGRAAPPAALPAPSASPRNLAYAIYTSGTTGRPKAVLVEHGSVATFREAIVERYGVGPSRKDAVVLLSNYVFDLTIEQIALSILSGNRLIVPAAASFSEDYEAEIARQGATLLSGTPSQIERLNLGRLTDLRQVVVAGESFLPHQFRALRAQFDGVVFNAYGTTETTVYNTVRLFAPGEPYANDLGQPLANTSLAIVDPDGNPAPFGAVGELWMAGPCLGRGYLGRPSLTRERFCPAAFAERSYRTGDLVRRHVGGALAYVGRNDTQVKIKGVRVEVGEIESVLAGVAGVRQCAVIARRGRHEPGDLRLLAYCVLEDGCTLSEAALRDALKAQLPPAMMPAAILVLPDALPLTSGGKLDQRALPDPDPAPAAFDGRPEDGVEARLIRLWSALVPGGSLGVEENFFDAGGDSIAAMQLTARMHHSFGRPLSARALFDFPTVRSYARGVLAHAPDPDREMPRPDPGPFRLLPVQRWFFDKGLPADEAFSQHFTIRTGPLDAGRLKLALERVLTFHEAFRLRFRRAEGGEVVQWIEQAEALPRLRVLALDGLSDAECDAALDAENGAFSTAGGPLHRAVYAHGFRDGSARLRVSMHHLIVDVVSWHVLVQDLEIAYRGGDLGPPRTGYGEWARAVGRYRAAPGEEEHWGRLARGVREQGTGGLVAAASGSFTRERLELDETVTAAILRQAGRPTARPADLLLVALGLALQAMTGRDTHYVTLEGHGREQFPGAPDVSDTVGWFTTMHPVEVEVCGDLVRSLDRVSAGRRRAPANGLGFGALRGTYGGDRAPLPPVSLNYLGVIAAAAADGTSDWRLDPARTGVQRRPASSTGLVDVTASVILGRMVIAVEARLAPVDVRQLANELRLHLGRLAQQARLDVQGAARRPSLAHERADAEQYVVVNEAISDRTVVLLPPGEGGAESYLGNLAGMLGTARLVLFNNLHRDSPAASFEALARRHLAALHAIQPEGPYHLAGWSFGGVLAFEMALQLARRGEKIASLVLIDPYFDVGRTLDDLALDGERIGFDPINMRYRPSPEDTRHLTAAVDRIVLFKATRTDTDRTRSAWRGLVDHYVRSKANNLDTLVPPSCLSIVLLEGATHFTWARDRRCVTLVAAEITKQVRGGARDEPHVSKVERSSVLQLGA